MQDEKVLKLSNSCAPSRFSLIVDPTTKEVFPASNSEGMIANPHSLLNTLENKNSLFNSLSSTQNSQSNLLIDNLSTTVEVDQSFDTKKGKIKRQGRVKFFTETDNKSSKRPKRSKRKKSHRIREGSSRFEINIDNVRLITELFLMEFPRPIWTIRLP